MSKEVNADSLSVQNDREDDDNISERTGDVQDDVINEPSEDLSSEAEDPEYEVNGIADEDSSEEANEENGDETPETALEYVGGASDEEKNANGGFRKLSFIEKCKHDPVIPVSIILIFLALIVAAIYFMLPDLKTPSMGMTLSDFITEFNEGEVVKALKTNGSDIGFRTPPYVDPDSKPSMLGDKAVFTASRSYADFFAGPSKYYSTSGIEGATRKNDGNLSYLRIWVQYTTADSEEEDSTTVLMYFASTLNVLYPELSMYEALDLGLKKMGEFDGDTRFYCRGNYAFRLVTVTKDDIGYIVIDVLPKAALNDSQIRETIEVTAESSAVSEETAESAVETAASDT